MREHPIPQDIVGYRFHIVGNMTIKQFAMLGGGCFVAFLFYSTNLVAVIKWPLVGMSIALGAAMAFVPYEERPLEHWVVTFIKTLYKPTKFYWRRQALVPEPFAYQPRSDIKQHEPEIDLSPARRQRIKEYLSSINRRTLSEEDAWREQRINGIVASFGQVQPVEVSIQKQTHKPVLKTRVRGLGAEHQEWKSGRFGRPLEGDKKQGSAQLTNIIPDNDKTITLRAALPTDQVATNIEIPEEKTVTLNTPEAAGDEVLGNIYQQPDADRAFVGSDVVGASAQLSDSAQSASFNQSLPFPSKPTEPNKVVGMVLTKDSDLVNDAIIEVKNQAGNTIRAVKTNALGQFYITTPLPDGKYQIHTEKDDYQFPAIDLELDQQVVEPIEIRSANA